MGVTVKTEIDFQPWTVPNFVRVLDVEGNAQELGFPVDQVGIEVVDAMASMWLDNLYAKLNKPSPWRMTGERS